MTLFQMFTGSEFFFFSNSDFKGWIKNISKGFGIYVNISEILIISHLFIKWIASIP